MCFCVCECHYSLCYCTRTLFGAPPKSGAFVQLAPFVPPQSLCLPDPPRLLVRHAPFCAVSLLSPGLACRPDLLSLGNTANDIRQLRRAKSQKNEPLLFCSTKKPPFALYSEFPALSYPIPPFFLPAALLLFPIIAVLEGALWGEKHRTDTPGRILPLCAVTLALSTWLARRVC